MEVQIFLKTKARNEHWLQERPLLTALHQSLYINHDKHQQNSKKGKSVPSDSPIKIRSSVQTRQVTGIPVEMRRKFKSWTEYDYHEIR